MARTFTNTPQPYYAQKANEADTIKNLHLATANKIGGIKADVKGEEDTISAKIGTDGKLYVPTYPTIPEIPVAANIPASEATTLELLLADFNALLAALKTAGLMAADEPEGEE
jgi:hypothetical protein